MQNVTDVLSRIRDVTAEALVEHELSVIGFSRFGTAPHETYRRFLKGSDIRADLARDIALTVVMFDLYLGSPSVAPAPGTFADDEAFENVIAVMADRR